MPQATEDRAAGRTLAVAAAAVVATVALLLVAVAGGASRPAPTGPVTPAAVVGRDPQDGPAAAALAALAVLREWDRRRAGAWRAGDAAALRGLYTAGSRAGERDVAMLRSWTGRGLRVRRMLMQVFAVELRARTHGRIVLVVTDRLTGPVAVGAAGRRWTLPRDGVTTRRLEFRRSGARWLLARVYDLPARPLASTSVTVGSAKS